MSLFEIQCTILAAQLHVLRDRAKAVRATGDRGALGPEWAYILAGIVVIVGIVVAAVTLAAENQLATIPGQ